MKWLGLLLTTLTSVLVASAPGAEPLPAGVRRHLESGIAHQTDAEAATTPADAQRLYQQAVTEYQLAATQRPGHYEAQLLWAMCLAQLSALATGREDRLRFAADADRRFAVAADCPEPNHLVFEQWANLLLGTMAGLATAPADRLAVLRKAAMAAERGLAIQSEPNRAPELHRHRGTALLMLADVAREPADQGALLEEALHHLRLASQSPLVRPTLHQNNLLGIALMSLGRFRNDPALLRDAAAEFTAALQSYPNNHATHYNLAAAWSLLGDAEQAGRHLAVAIDHDPDRQFERMAEQDPDLAPVRGTAAYTAALDRRRRQAADAKATELRQRGRQAQQAAGLTREPGAATARLEEALRLYEQAAALVPDHFESTILHAATLIQLGQLAAPHSEQQRRYFAAAAQRFAAAARCPDVEPYLYDQWSNFLVGTWYPQMRTRADQAEILAQARAVLEQGITVARFSGLRGKLESQLAHCLVLLAQSIAATATDTSEAPRERRPPSPQGADHSPAMEGATPAAPPSPTALYLEAARHFAIADKIQETTRTASFYELWGIALLRAGQPSRDALLMLQAVERFNKAIALSPDDPVLYYNLACAYSQLRHFDQALRHLQRSLATDPDRQLRRAAEQDPFLEPLRQADAYHRAFPRADRMPPSPTPGLSPD